MYIADTNNNRIRKVTVSTGIITTIAGTGTSSYSGDGGAATSAALNCPEGLAVDSSGTVTHNSLVFFSLISPMLSLLGNLFISESTNHVIRKVAVSTGIISTFAGTGASGFSGDGGPATSATFKQPKGLALDASGTPIWQLT